MSITFVQSLAERLTILATVLGAKGLSCTASHGLKGKISFGSLWSAADIIQSTASEALIAFWRDPSAVSLAFRSVLIKAVVLNSVSTVAGLAMVMSMTSLSSILRLSKKPLTANLDAE